MKNLKKAIYRIDIGLWCIIALFAMGIIVTLPVLH